MAYFEDLTPYVYLALDDGFSALNVGWLDKNHPFRRWHPPAEFIAALGLLAETAQVHQTRGWHDCEFCSTESVDNDDRRGSCEIRVVGEDGTTFLAPFLIRHYVIAHGYRPPDAFVSAVKSQAKARPRRRSG